MKAEAGRKGRWDEERPMPGHVTSFYELRASSSLVSKPSGAETSCRQTGRFTSAVPQLPVTLTVVGFKSGLALELPGYTWRSVIKKEETQGGNELLS